jgi:hypothetical protein
MFVTSIPIGLSQTTSRGAITVWDKMVEALEIAEYEAEHPHPVAPKPLDNRGAQ